MSTIPIVIDMDAVLFAKCGAEMEGEITEAQSEEFWVHIQQRLEWCGLLGERLVALKRGAMPDFPGESGVQARDWLILSGRACEAYYWPILGIYPERRAIEVKP